MCCIKSYCCQGEGMILEGGDTWTVEDNILGDRGGSGRSQEPGGVEVWGGR